MNVAKWLVLALLVLPLAELTAFIAVASALGFLRALALLLATSFAGALVLRHAGGSHIARIRTAWGQGSVTSLQADSSGALVLLAGILLLLPGFITDAVGLLLLLSPLRRAFSAAFGLGTTPTRADGVVDLPPDDWRRVPDPALPDASENERKG